MAKLGGQERGDRPCARAGEADVEIGERGVKMNLLASVSSEAVNACASFCPMAPATVPTAICPNWLLGASARPSAEPSTWPTTEKSMVLPLLGWPSSLGFAEVILPEASW